jgi:hypothetical protein
MCARAPESALANNGIRQFFLALRYRDLRGHGPGAAAAWAVGHSITHLYRARNSAGPPSFSSLAYIADIQAEKKHGQ